MRLGVVCALVVLAQLPAIPVGAHAQNKTVKIGVLNDQSGFYSDVAGAGSVLAAQMAVEDSGLLDQGWTIEVISGDHQNKPDIGVNIARHWFDRDGVDAIADVVTSSVALAVNNLVRDKNKVMLASGAGTSDLTGSQCSPNTVQWTYDTYMLAHGTGAALTRSGGTSWFFLTADYAFGAALERDTSKAIASQGGNVLGSVRHPINSSDFSSFLLQAQASKARVVGLANASGDTINSIKQAAEFGIVSGGQKLAGLVLLITDIHALGLATAQGLNFTESFYWDLDDGTRAFAMRFQKRMKNGYMPTMIQAGVYASVAHYLKAMKKTGENPRNGIQLIEAMKTMPTDDELFGKGYIQANGRKVHPAYLFEVKKPSESKYGWDYYRRVATIPAEEAFMPLVKSTCPILKQ
jgi:branched-chain amino acid transport system substrate-binding protein